MKIIGASIPDIYPNGIVLGDAAVASNGSSITVVTSAAAATLDMIYKGASHFRIYGDVDASNVSVYLGINNTSSTVRSITLAGTASNLDLSLIPKGTGHVTVPGGYESGVTADDLVTMQWVDDQGFGAGSGTVGGTGTNNQVAIWNGTADIDALAFTSNTEVLTLVGGIPAWADPISSVLKRANLRTTDSTTSFGSLTHTAIDWDATADYIDTDVFTHSTGTNPSRLEVEEDGVYTLKATMGWTTNQTGQRMTMEAFFKVNGTTSYPASTGRSYHRGTTYGNATTEISAEISLSANDYIEVFFGVDIYNAAYTATLLISECEFTARKATATAVGNTWRPLPNMADINDVTITSIASGELLTWNGSIFINETLAQAGISATSHNHTGVYLQDSAGTISGITLTDNGTTVTLGGAVAGLAASVITTGTFSNTFLASVNGTVTNGTHSGTNTGDEAIATATVAGIVELWSNTDNPTGANSVTSTAARTYGIQLNAANQMVVNVPWTAGTGTVTASGGPADGEVAVWTTATNIEGQSDFTWDADILRVQGPSAGQSWYANVSAGDKVMYLATDQSGEAAEILIGSLFNNAGNDASVYVAVHDTGGDPFIKFTGGATFGYSLGVDNSATNNPFKITYVGNSAISPSLGTTLLTVQSDGEILFHSNVGGSAGAGTFLNKDGGWTTPPGTGSGWAVTGSTTLTGAVTIDGAYDIEIGTDTGSRTYRLFSGNTASGQTKTIEIGYGLFGSTVNIGIGNTAATAGATTFHSAELFHSNLPPTGDVGPDRILVQDSATGQFKLALASGGGTTNFLRADGAWAAAGGGTPSDITVTASTATLLYLTFVDNATTGTRSLYTDAGMSYNATSNQFTIAGQVNMTSGWDSDAQCQITTNNDIQLYLASADTWCGIQFNDSGAQNDSIWFNGANGGTFAIGGGGADVANKKLHVDGGMTIGSGYDATAVAADSLVVQGNITLAGYITNTWHGATAPAIETITTGNWDKPQGYSRMVSTASTGEPSGSSHGYYFITARRDTSNGYGGIYQDYSGGRLWSGTNTTGGDPIWNLVCTAAGTFTKTSGDIVINNSQKIGFGTSSGEATLYSDGTYLQLDMAADKDFYISDLTTTRFLFDSSSGAFHADNNITAYSTSVSDRRLKKNIVYTSPKVALELILSLDAITYNNKYKYTDVIHSGYIAQEFEDYLPHLILESKVMNIPGDREDLYKTINYTEIIPYITEAMKEHDRRIVELEFNNVTLTKTTKQLRYELNKYKKLWHNR